MLSVRALRSKETGTLMEALREKETLVGVGLVRAAEWMGRATPSTIFWVMAGIMNEETRMGY
jgi:hypothetical protein